MALAHSMDALISELQAATPSTMPEGSPQESLEAMVRGMSKIRGCQPSVLKPVNAPGRGAITPSQ